MEPNTEEQGTQNDPVDVVQIPKAELEELRKKAEVSSQNFTRAKSAEEQLKELKPKLEEMGKGNFDPDALRKEIDAKVDLRLAGHSPEEISEIEKYAKGAGVSLTEAAQSPFVKSAVEAIRAVKKSTDNTPAPSSKIKVFNGKPVEEIFKSGSAAEKQAAFEAKMKGGVKQSE